MSDNIIEVNNVSMKFNLYKQKVDGIKEFFIKKIKRTISYEEFCALKDISFCVKKGSSIALIGRNGSGKSTLLKLIAGVMKPTTGKIKVFGSVAPLIELGAGFDIELTAKENIYLNCAVLGYSRKETNYKLDEIIEFSELKEFIDVPVKNFSSGMYARLGFSIATANRPDILIVDEILSVGDFKFQEKCGIKIQSMIKKGTNLLFVSHNTKQVEELCDQAIWLDSGKIRMIGESKHICKEYSSS